MQTSNGQSIHDLVEQTAEEATNRQEFWATLLNRVGSENLAELGVWQGGFAAHLLHSCPSIVSYYLVDPWRPLEDWNKPLNVSAQVFAKAKDLALERTEFAAGKRVVLEGRTTEVLDTIADSSLDFVYVDGDHTLKGVTIDLTSCYPKVKPGGLIGGDDFTSSIWQHGPEYEPTMVFPFAVYFAEATGSTIFGLPFDQFLIVKPIGRPQFQFVDLTAGYSEMGLRGQIERPISLTHRLWRTLEAPARSIAKRVRNRLR